MLETYFQNHRRYVKSRDDNQLLGTNENTISADCEPFRYHNSKNQHYAPCGAIANSIFNGNFVEHFFLQDLNHEI